MRSTRALGVEEVGLAGAGPAAAHVDARHHGFVEQERGDAAGEPQIGGVADPEAGDVGDAVGQHGASPEDVPRDPRIEPSASGAAARWASKPVAAGPAASERSSIAGIV